MHEILVELEFTSERARMSVVARAPDGTIRLFTKGSDAVRFFCSSRVLMQLNPASPKDAPNRTNRLLTKGSNAMDCPLQGVMLMLRTCPDCGTLHKTVLKARTPGE